jgi:hypothetical protein
MFRLVYPKPFCDCLQDSPGCSRGREIEKSERIFNHTYLQDVKMVLPREPRQLQFSPQMDADGTQIKADRYVSVRMWDRAAHPDSSRCRGSAAEYLHLDLIRVYLRLIKLLSKLPFFPSPLHAGGSPCLFTSFLRSFFIRILKKLSDSYSTVFPVCLPHVYIFSLIFQAG